MRSTTREWMWYFMASERNESGHPIELNTRATSGLLLLRHVINTSVLP